MQRVYLEPPCRCEACAENAQAAEDCRYAGFADVAGLYLDYQDYVVHGHTPLASLPVWFREVGRLVRHYQTLRETRGLRDIQEKNTQRKMLEKLGVRYGRITHV